MQSGLFSLLRRNNTGAAAGEGTPVTIEDLMFWYDMDDGNDSGPNALHLTPSAPPPTHVVSDGRKGGYANFDNPSQQLFSHADDVAFRPNGSFTVCGWMNPTNFTYVSSGYKMFKLGNFGPKGYSMTHESSKAEFIVWDNTFPASEADNFITNQPGVWKFFLGEYDLTTNKIRLFVDNVLIDEAVAHPPLSITPGTIYFGAASPGTEHMHGGLDSIAGWKRLLTADEKTWLHNNGMGREYADIPWTPLHIADLALGASLVDGNVYQTEGGALSVAGGGNPTGYVRYTPAMWGTALDFERTVGMGGTPPALESAGNGGGVSAGGGGESLMCTDLVLGAAFTLYAVVNYLDNLGAIALGNQSTGMGFGIVSYYVFLESDDFTVVLSNLGGVVGLNLLRAEIDDNAYLISCTGMTDFGGVDPSLASTTFTINELIRATGAGIASDAGCGVKAVLVVPRAIVGTAEDTKILAFLEAEYGAAL